MEGRHADVRFPADGRGRLTALRPAQDRYDLLRGVSFSFSFWHLGPFLGAQSLISDGSVRVSQVNGTLIGQVCHIKGKKKGAKRFDALQSETERHGEANLILLCGKHHTVVDDLMSTYEFSVNELQQYKKDHELKCETLWDLADLTVEQLLDPEFRNVFGYFEPDPDLRGAVLEFYKRSDRGRLIREWVYGSKRWHILNAGKLAIVDSPSRENDIRLGLGVMIILFLMLATFNLPLFVLRSPNPIMMFSVNAALAIGMMSFGRFFVFPGVSCRKIKERLAVAAPSSVN